MSFSTTSVCASIVGSTAWAARSSLIWRCSAILARLSNLSASAVLPPRRSSSALRLAAMALLPHSVGGLDVLLVVALEQAQVADRLGDRRLGVGDAVGVVPHQLVEHLLRVLGGVEDRVDVRPHEGGDSAEDGLLRHRWFLPIGGFCGCQVRDVGCRGRGVRGASGQKRPPPRRPRVPPPPKLPGLRIPPPEDPPPEHAAEAAGRAAPPPPSIELMTMPPRTAPEHPAAADRRPATVRRAAEHAAEAAAVEGADVVLSELDRGAGELVGALGVLHRLLRIARPAAAGRARARRRPRRAACGPPLRPRRVEP